MDLRGTRKLLEEHTQHYAVLSSQHVTFDSPT
jgi:hypothetical protein